MREGRVDTKSQERRRAAARAAAEKALAAGAVRVTLPGPLPDQRDYLSSIAKWEQESREAGVVIHTRAKRVGKNRNK